MPAWTWAAASRRGTAHAAAGERRQDAMRVVAPRGSGGFIVAVACDGAGSAIRGGKGAALAARTFAVGARLSLTARDGLPEEFVVDLWASLANLRIAAAAELRGLAPADFATTVVMAASNGATTLTAHIGDGAVVARDAGSGLWVPLSWPEHGEFAATTFFLTDDGGPRLRVARHDRAIDRLCVMTDGVERLALDFAAGAPHAPFLDALSGPIAASGVAGRDRRLSAALAAFLDSERVAERTDDDKTLVIAALA